MQNNTSASPESTARSKISSPTSGDEHSSETNFGCQRCQPSFDFDYSHFLFKVFP
jgi:hypothetical protein